MIQHFQKVLLKWAMSANGMLLSGEEAPFQPAILKIFGEQENFSKWEPALVKSLLEADVVQEIKVTILPVIHGGSGTTKRSRFFDGFLPQDRGFKLIEMMCENASLHLHYAKKRSRGGCIS